MGFKRYVASAVRPLLTFTDTGFTNVGPMQILGGTSAYAGIVGHGIGVGATDFETGLGGGTTTGFVRVR